MFRNRMWKLAATALLLALAPALPAQAVEHSPRSLIRYTEHGIPHIVAQNFDGLGYGYGYAAAKDNICELANTYLTVDAQRSRYLGPDGQANPAMSNSGTNLNSDLHFQRIKDAGVVERLLAQPAPAGPRPEVREIISGYVQGYNRYFAETGPDRITDPACHGAPWLRPIADLDVYRHFYAISTKSGQGAMTDGLVNAQPGAGAAKRAPAAAVSADRIGGGLNSLLGKDELGSNGIAIGSEGTTNGGSVLLGNPHYPWQGGSRFWQSQLTIPGRFNVSGASLLGLPLIQIGHTANAAWTHTVATPTTFGLYELRLAPGDQTSYLVDGKQEKMVTATVRVQAKRPDGSIGEVQRTLYSTRYGPMLSSVADVSLPWTQTSAYALRDGNATNLRGLNTWFELNQAQNTDQIVSALSRTQGAPWVNTIATDRFGNAVYADIQVVPHVTDELERRCGTPLGHVLFGKSGVSILDGSASSCGWGSDPGAIEPGLFAPDRLPSLQRKDYALNANDSAWLANARAPISGYPRIVGDIGTERSPRTREALISAEEGLAGKSFNTESMKSMLFGDRSRVAELAAADTAKMCAAFPGGQAPSAKGPVDVRAACAALAGWDHTYRLDSRGSLLFERFVSKLGRGPGGPWLVPFDPKNPVHTPNTLNTGSVAVQTAFGNAAAELRDGGIPLDAKLADYQGVTRNGNRIPIHGGPSFLGVLDVITPVWDQGKGNVEVRHGSSFIQVVGFGRAGCPDTSTLLTYSQSADPTSPYFTDQTELFSRGQWVRGRFCEQDIWTSPGLRVVYLR